MLIDETFRFYKSKQLNFLAWQKIKNGYEKHEKQVHVESFIRLRRVLMGIDKSCFVPNEFTSYKTIIDSLEQENDFSAEFWSGFMVKCNDQDECYFFNMYDFWAPDYEDEPEDFIALLNNKNSFKILKQNFIEILTAWKNVRLNEPPFVLLWQDDDQWIHVETFDDEQKFVSRIDEVGKVIDESFVE